MSVGLVGHTILATLGLGAILRTFEWLFPAAEAAPMNTVVANRMAAQIDGEVIVFLIGMRINRVWKLHKWWPVVRAMPRMLRELRAADSGLLGFHTWIGNPTITLQYWRSFEDLEHYAKDPGHAHRSAWAAFNRAIASNGDVGIWHETYRVRPGDFECIYNNMPLFGLARATKSVPAQGRRESAGGRMGAGLLAGEAKPKTYAKTAESGAKRTPSVRTAARRLCVRLVPSLRSSGVRT